MTLVGVCMAQGHLNTLVTVWRAQGHDQDHPGRCMDGPGASKYAPWSLYGGPRDMIKIILVGV